MADHELEETGLWVTFCCANSDKSTLTWFGEHGVDAPGDEAGFDAAWAQGCETVAAELGPPGLTLAGDDEANRNIAGWRIGSTVLLVGQTQDEYISQGDMDLAAVWLFPHPKDKAWPDGDELRTWLFSGRQ